SRHGQSQLKSRARQAVAQCSINQDDVKTVWIPIPALSEQRAITQMLRVVQRARESTEAVIAAAREVRRSLLHHLFTYGPIPVYQADTASLSTTEIGPQPSDWGLVRLDDILEARLGKMLSGAARRNISPRPYLRNANVQWGRVDTADLLEMDFAES